MHPIYKGLKQRKDSFRPISFSSTRKRFLSTNQVGNQNAANIQTMLSLADKMKDYTGKGQILGKYTSNMDQRDHYVLLQIPTLTLVKHQREKQIKVWLGDVCRRVFSTSFHYFKGEIFDTQTTKVFCSESFLGNILELSKKNQLTSEDFQLINNHLKEQLLPYFLLRYPQSNNNQINQNLNRLISQTDAIQTNQNDMFLKSGIAFQYRQDGLYHDLIMKFINYVLQLPDMTIQKQKKWKSNTIFDNFNEVMQKLFTSVQNRDWTETDLYDHYENSDENIETLRSKVETLQQQTINRKNKNKQYADQVASYTKYAINRKLSENIPLFSKQQIMYGNIEIKNSSVLRIIVKWCKQLEQKFEKQYYIDRDQPFVMNNKREVDMISEYRQTLDQYAREQWKQIQKFLQNISNHLNRGQSLLSFQNLMFYSQNKYPEFQQSIIKFAGKNTKDVIHYSVAYLNRLIHGLLKISIKMYEGRLRNWAQWSYPPQLITFTISDLVRCKCFSQQKQIIRIYKQLQIQSQISPQFIRIVRVKNRLNRGTKDILLNILFHEKVLCQVQLAIKFQYSEFILYSDKFNHYIYELKRSLFGPINQMCSIWSTSDERSSLLEDDKTFVALQKNHLCQTNLLKQNKKVDIQQILQEQILPFTCTKCEKHFSQKRYIFYHKKCTKCDNFWLCGLCRMNRVSDEDLIEELKLDKNKVVHRIYEVDKISEYIIIYRIASSQIIPIPCRIFQLEKSSYFIYFQEQQMKVYKMKGLDKDSFTNFLQLYVVFQLKYPDPKLNQISTQDVMDYLVLQQIQESYSKKWEAIRIANRNITKQLLLKINDQRGQSVIKNLSFPNNHIKDIQEIGAKFNNVRFLNLNNNGLQSMKGIGNMSGLTDVYLAGNKFTEIVQLQNLKKLKYIQLGDNNNSPTIKCDLSNLNKLQSLTLVSSNLSQFPLALTDIKNLKLLWLYHNHISQIPKQISKLKYLQHLQLGQNLIQRLPDQMFQLKNIQKLTLKNNKLTQLSPLISAYTKLTGFSLYGNKISPQKFAAQQLGNIYSLKRCQLDIELQPKIRQKLNPYRQSIFYYVNLNMYK